jgi:hypothetical protein
MKRNIEVQNENRAMEESMSEMEKELVATKMKWSQGHDEGRSISGGGSRGSRKSVRVHQFRHFRLNDISFNIQPEMPKLMNSNRFPRTTRTSARNGATFVAEVLVVLGNLFEFISFGISG